MAGYNVPSYALIPPSNLNTTTPVLHIAPTEDPLVIVSSNAAATRAFNPDAESRNESAGHWGHLERKG